jgi:hypothetical protein
MSSTASTLELNQRNREFWRREAEEAKRRLADADLRAIALAFLADERARSVPIRNQKSWEQTLRDSEGMLQRSQHRLSRLGGKAKKQDALQLLIVKIVLKQPKITGKQLVLELEKVRDARGGIDDIEDGTIHFVDGGHLKSAPVSGVKDRLSRAKRTVNSR